MAVSGSNDFALTASDLITEARKKIGIHAAEEPISAAELVSGLKTLNIMLKAWQVEGVSFSQYTEGTITLTQSDYDLVFGSGGDFTTVPFDIIDVRITRNSIDTPMIELSREEYYALPQKDNEGFPTQWFYDRQRNGGTMYLWPAPDADAGTLGFTYMAQIDDMDANANSLDLPTEWYEAVTYNLADRFSEELGLINSPLGQRVAQKAAEKFESVKEFDVGEGKGSISITPGYY
ncbi:MAG: hypothetical protein GY941_12855 [Planctomycetes bacterium]|nr:hypothetical protein [Planctomycetota bacterium]